MNERWKDYGKLFSEEDEEKLKVLPNFFWERLNKTTSILTTLDLCYEYELYKTAKNIREGLTHLWSKYAHELYEG